MSYPTFIRGLDWGSYLANGLVQFDWPMLIEKLGIQFFVTKGLQEELPAYSTLRNMQAARSGGIPIVATYYWHYPYLSGAYQISLYKPAIDRENPDFIAVDIEQFTDASGNRVDPQRISDTAQELCEGLASLYPEKRVCVYSRQGFPIEFSPMMDLWLPKFDGGWVASWPDYGSLKYYMALEDIAANKTKCTYLGGVLIDIDNDGWQPSNMKAWKIWSIWQYSSRMLLPLSITGIYQHQNDWNVYNGSLEGMLAWCKKEVVTPPVEPPIEPPVEVNLSSIHDVNVSIGDRAWVLAIESDQVVKDKNYTATWMDGFNLPMGGMKIALEPDGDKILELGAEPTFEGRCKELASKGFPVGGCFTIDPGALLKVGFTAPAIEANILTKDKDGKLVVNQIAAAVIDSWHDGVWTIDSVFNSKGKWLPVSHILLHMMATDAYPAGAIIGNDWQSRVFVRVFDTIRYLIENEGAPDIPIILFCSDDKNAQLGKVWLQYYDNGEFGQSIHNRAGNLYLALAKKSLASTDTFIDFGFFTFASDPVINYIPDGFANRLLMYEFTSGNQKCKLVTDKNGVPTPISGALWCKPKAAMYDFLGVGETESPPVIPPETSGSSTSGSSTSGSSINPTIIDSMLLRLAKIETYLKTIQKFE